MSLLRKIKDWWDRDKELTEQVEEEVNQAYDDWENELMPLPLSRSSTGR